MLIVPISDRDTSTARFLLLMFAYLAFLFFAVFLLFQIKYKADKNDLLPTMIFPAVIKKMIKCIQKERLLSDPLSEKEPYTNRPAKLMSVSILRTQTYNLFTRGLKLSFLYSVQAGLPA